MDARLAGPREGPAGVAAAVDVLTGRPQGADPPGRPLPAVGVEDGHDPAVHAERDVERPGRQRQLLDAATEEPRDELTAGREERVPLGPDLHPPLGGVLVEVPDLRPQVRGAEGGPVQLGHVGDQPGAVVVLAHGAAERGGRRAEPPVPDRLAVVHRRRQPRLAAGEVDRAARRTPERPGDPVQPGHQRAHGEQRARGARRRGGNPGTVAEQGRRGNRRRRQRR